MNKYELKDLSRKKFYDFNIESGGVNGDFKIHSHNFCEIFFVLSGTGKHISGDTEYFLKRGELFAVKGSEQHGFTSCTDLKIINIMFKISPEIIQMCKDIPGFWVLFLHEQNIGSISHISLSEEECIQVKSWCDILMREYKEDRPGNIAVCYSILIQLIVFLSRRCENIPENLLQLDFKIAKALIFLESNYIEKTDLNKLARIVGFSPRHLSRLFEEFYKTSPMKYLMNIRLNHAKQLLIKTNYSITEVAGLCGFSDGNHFSKAFRQHIGQPPNEWRKNFQN